MAKANHDPIATSLGHKPATMTPRHFEGLARLLGGIGDRSERDRITQQAIEWCARTNAKFNPGRFRTAVATAAARRLEESCRVRGAPTTIIKLLRDAAYAPSCYIIARQRADGTFDTRDEANTVLIQTDWDFPAIARVFGMPWGDRACAHRGTDRTIDCPECGITAEIFLATAAHWLAEHIGASANDPGYFK